MLVGFKGFVLDVPLNGDYEHPERELEVAFGNGGAPIVSHLHEDGRRREDGEGFGVLMESHQFFQCGIDAGFLLESFHGRFRMTFGLSIIRWCKVWRMCPNVA